MAQPPFSVQFHDDPANKFRFDQNTPDDEWLAKVANEGWIIFSHDRKFHKILAECSAIKQHNGACFYLPGGAYPIWEKLTAFTRSYDGIMKRIRATRKPFIYDVTYRFRFKTVKIP